MTQLTIDLPPISRRLRLLDAMRRLLAAITGHPAESGARERLFAQVMREYSSVISGICLSYATDGDDLKDLRQDIMINIWKGLAAFRGDSSLSTWIYRVALNTCVSTVRKRSNRPSTVPLDALADMETEPDSAHKENLETLYALIAHLSPLDKALITMWLDDRKYDEIAEVTGLSRNNVAVRINRIKQKLHHKFTPLNQ